MHPMLILTLITYLSEIRLHLSVTVWNYVWKGDALLSLFLCYSEFHPFRRLAGHMPAPVRRNAEAEQHLKLFVHCPSHYKAQKAAAQQPREATSSWTSQVGGLLSPHGWSLEIRKVHNSLFEAWLHLLFGEACTKATGLKPHYNCFYFFSIFSHC